MIKSFRRAGLEQFFTTSPKAGIISANATRLSVQLGLLNIAVSPEELNVPGYKFHTLKGDLAGHSAVTVNKNLCFTFRFEGQKVVLVDYQDYH